MDYKLARYFWLYVNIFLFSFRIDNQISGLKVVILKFKFFNLFLKILILIYLKNPQVLT